MKIITPEQEIEKKKHQKQKLSLKDRMERILHEYESSAYLLRFFKYIQDDLSSSRGIK